MVCKESSYFFVKPCGGQLLSRLAPGISVTFAVTFQPIQFEDYTHKVTFYTDIDQYVVPLIGMIFLTNFHCEPNLIILFYTYIRFLFILTLYLRVSDSYSNYSSLFYTFRVKFNKYIYFLLISF